jgi:pimeloyl-ACP methyl ester carboxylesterase
VNRATKLALAGAAGVASGAAAFALARQFRPKGTTPLSHPDPGRARPRLDDALFDMPDGLVVHDLDTPDGGTIHVVEKGQGRPLLLLHGVTLRHDVWAPQFHQLTDRYRVLAVDLRGHGESVPGSAGFGMRPLADDIATVLTELDLHEAIVAGHSMGGMATMNFLGLHPDVVAERVVAVALIATAASDAVPPYLSNLARAAVRIGEAEVARGQRLRAKSFAKRFARLAFGAAPSPRAVAIVGDMVESMTEHHLVPSLAGILDHDARVHIRACPVPSLVVVGARDALTPVPAARQMARLLPGCELVVLPLAGHQLMQERPDELAELFDALARRAEGLAPTVRAAVADDDRPVDPAHVEAPTPAR